MRTLYAKISYDHVEEVRKGARGADCLLNVTLAGSVNSIFIESKVTKEFGREWVGKLRGDMRDRDAVFGVIVTDAMPKDRPSAHVDGNIWICRFHEYLNIVAALRLSLDQMNRLTVSEAK